MNVRIYKENEIIGVDYWSFHTEVVVRQRTDGTYYVLANRSGDSIEPVMTEKEFKQWLFIAKL